MRSLERMVRALAGGFAVGAGLGLLVRRWTHRRLKYGPWGSLGMGLPGGPGSVGLALMQTITGRNHRKLVVVDDRAFGADFEERWRLDRSRSRQLTGHAEASPGSEPAPTARAAPAG